MKKISKILLSLTFIFSLGFISTPVFAADCSGGINDASCNKSCSGIDSDPVLTPEDKQTLKAAAGCNETSDDSINNHALNIINVVISVVGLIAVLVIVMGGQRYIVSAGDPGKIKQAKDMILYAVVALIVAGLAFAIVNFVSKAIKTDANTGAALLLQK